MSRVRDAMVSDPLTLDASASAQQAGARLADPGVRAVLVCDGGRARSASSRGRRSSARSSPPAAIRRRRCSATIAEPPIFTLDADEDLDAAFRELEERDLERVPVTENGRLVGILSRAVVQRRLAEDEPPAEDSRLAAGVGAGRRVALDRLRQLGRRERDAVQQVALARAQRVEAVAPQHLARRSSRRRRSPARGRDRAPGKSPPLVERQRREPRELLARRRRA